MNETARFKLNLITGEVEIEGSEEFVERQIQQLETVIETVRLRTQQREEGSEGVQDEARETKRETGSRKLRTFVYSVRTPEPTSTFQNYVFWGIG